MGDGGNWFLRVVLEDAVATNFWTLPIIRPMFTNVRPFLRWHPKKGIVET